MRKIYPFPFYASTNTINNIRFSSREIDILACVAGGRTAKKIASFLSLSPRTVENYIHNITLKLECNSRESLIDFIEKSDKFFLIKEHYSNLLIQVEFKKTLKEISKLNHQALACVLVCKEEQYPKKSFVHLLEKHLKLVGLGITVESEKEFTPFSQNIVVLQLAKDSLNQPVSLAKQKLIISLERDHSIGGLKELEEFDDKNIIKEKNYYF